MGQNTTVAFNAGSIASANVTTTSSTVLAANPNRNYLVLTNTGVNDVSLNCFGAAIAGQGIILKANGGYYESHQLNLTKLAFTGITASGTSTIAIFEGTI
jgi:hypothetical protein